MAAHTENEQFLRDGALVIYQRTDVASLNWHCRIKFPNLPYIRRSLKCKSETDAKRNANKLYDDLRFRFERGLALESQPFPCAADEQFKWLEDQIDAEQNENKIKLLKRKLVDHRNTAKYAIEFFDKIYIDKITDLDIERYKEWRKTYWTRGPGADKKTIEYVRNGRMVKAPRPKSGIPALSTMAREDVVLRAIFDRARKLGWVTGDQIPEIISERPKSNRRPGFTEQEIRKLLAVAERRINEEQSDHIKYLRGMVRDFVGLMSATGMRPVEAMGLQGGDIQRFKTKNDKWATKIFVKGKGKKRTLIARDDADQYVFEIYRRISEWKHKEIGFIEDLVGPVYEQMGTEYKRLPALHDSLWGIFSSVANKQDLEQYRQILVPKFTEDDDGQSYDSNQQTREDFYEALTEFGMCMKLALSSRAFFEDNSFSEDDIASYKDDLKWFTGLRKIAKQDAQETVDYSAYENQIRRLVDKHVVGTQIRESDGVIDLNKMGNSNPEEWTEEKTRNETDIIRSRVKKTIEQDLADDPYAQAIFSELLLEAIADANSMFDFPYKQYMLFKEIEEKINDRDIDGIPDAFGENQHAKAYFGTFRLVLGNGHFGGIDDAIEKQYINAALDIDELVRNAVATHSLNPQNIEAEIRKGLLPDLFKLIGLDAAKDVIERVIQITRIGLSRGNI